jgi:hypothetical protein
MEFEDLKMDTFSIAPVSAKALWFLPAILIPVFVLIAGITFATIHGATKTRFEVSPDGLRLRGDLYGRFIPTAELRVAEARRVDFAANPDLAPSWKTMGTGLPGYQSGWFHLKNGSRGLLYLTDRSRAVIVPTTNDYSVLVSPEDPDAFLSALKRARR